MSRYDSDQDYSDCLNGPYGSCEDCGRATDDAFCEECGDKRDAHAAALEVRMMAHAVLRSTRPIKDVA